MSKPDLLAHINKALSEQGEFNALSVDLAASIMGKISGRFDPEIKTREPKVLYASEIGKKCNRQVWYRINVPHKAELMPAQASFKFMYGDMIEDVAVFLLKKAGLPVEDEQRRVQLTLPNGWSVRGKIDLRIGDNVIDVKSASQYSYESLSKGINNETDKFGYREQIDFYQKTLIGKGNGTILLINKSSGDMNQIDVPGWDSDDDMHMALTKRTDELSLGMPERQFKEETSTYGNKVLGTECKYCDFKKECWPGLRGFKSSKGTVWMTQVKHTNLTEIK